VIDLRKTVVYLWDEKGQPPRVGYDKSEIAEQFQKLEQIITTTFEQTDEHTGERNIVRNTLNLGNAVNQFFPTMMKTRINYTKDPSAGKSIYDFFAKDSLLDTFVTYASRHFKRDSFYHYSVPVRVSDTERYPVLPVAATGVKWIELYENVGFRNRGIWDYWLAPRGEEQEYTGYNEDLKDKQYLRLSRAEIEALGDFIPEKCKTNVDWKRS